MAFTALTTIANVKKGASTASLQLVRYEDGTVEYTDTKGKIVRCNNVHVTEIFNRINSLV